MCFSIYYKMRYKQNIAEQDKGTESSPFYTRSFYTSMIRLQCIHLAFKNFFYRIYYVILFYLLLLTFHEVQIIHFRHSIFYFIMYILACECL
jgi:hypothetical protein